MQFDILFEETIKQLEFDFRNIPAWARALGSMWENVFRDRYYPIKNMSKSKQRDAAFRKFWTKVINTLKTKGLNTQKIKELGVPEYMFFTHY
jgi:hypothetical protein